MEVEPHIAGALTSEEPDIDMGATYRILAFQSWQRNAFKTYKSLTTQMLQSNSLISLMR